MKQTFENKNIYKDFDMSFSRNPLTNDLGTKSDERAIQQSLRSLLNTNYYERPFRPEVGSNIRNLLFEQADVFLVDDIKNAITEVIVNYEPRIAIISLDVVDKNEMNAYEVSLTYRMNSTQDVKQITLTLKRLR